MSSGLKLLGIPNSVTKIGSEAFAYSGITSIDFTSGIKEIGESAFQKTELVKIKIPSSVTTIEKNAFGFCKKIESIEVDEKNPNYISSNNCFIEKANKSIVVGCKNSVIPKDGTVVTNIADKAFSFCEDLTLIKIPSNIEEIGSEAFIGCKGLKTIEMESGLKTIKTNAFLYCSSLTQIVLPSSVESIESSLISSCAKLEAITVLSTIPPATIVESGSWNLFYPNPGQAEEDVVTPLKSIYVQAHLVDTYKAAEHWATYASLIKPL